MTTSWAATERTALIDLMASLGPDADTLPDGWATHDLAAHLVVRERRPQALPGLVVPALHPVTAALERRMRRLPFDELIDRLRGGPPVWSPGGLLPGPLAGLTDLHEMFVHHEDVRRVEDRAARALDPGLEDALWSRVRVMGPALTARASGLGITAEAGEGRRARLRPGADEVVLRGAPGELLLWLFGRREAAHVEVLGHADAVARAGSVRLGW